LPKGTNGARPKSKYQSPNVKVQMSKGKERRGKVEVKAEGMQ
jgi:hypothetical protein